MVIPAPVHFRRGSLAGQSRDRLLRNQNAGKNYRDDGSKKTQVQKIVDASADGFLSEYAAALASDPAPGEQQVSENHAYHCEAKPLVNNQSGKRTVCSKQTEISNATS